MTSTYALPAVLSIGDLISHDLILNGLRNSIDFLRDPPRTTYSPSLADANITTTSTVFVDITGFSVTVVSQGKPVDVEFMARVNTTNGRFDLLVDGVSVTGDNDGLGAAAPVSTFCAVNIKRRIAVSAGSHTYKIQWRATAGTLTLYPAGLAQLTAVEKG